MAEVSYPPFAGPLVRRWCDLMTEWDLRREHHSRLIRARVDGRPVELAEQETTEARSQVLRFELETIGDMYLILRLIEQREPGKLCGVFDKLGLVTRDEFERRIGDLEEAVEFLLGKLNDKDQRETRKSEATRREGSIAGVGVG